MSNYKPFSRKEMLRGARYALVGFSTFSFDLIILTVLVEVFSLREFIAAGIAFLIAVSINYVLARRFVFSETKRSYKTGYEIFIVLALVGITLISSLMYLAVDIWGFDYMPSRIVIAGIVGLSGYFINYFFNFKIQEQD